MKWPINNSRIPALSIFGVYFKVYPDFIYGDDPYDPSAPYDFFYCNFIPKPDPMTCFVDFKSIKVLQEVNIKLKDRIIKFNNQ